MKKILPFVVLVVLSGLLIWSCKKDEPLQPYYGADYGDLQYSIKGVRDTMLEQTGKVSFNLFVERTAGKYEEVGLSVKGLPEGMTATFALNEATPNYNTFITFEANQVDAGTYTIQIIGASQTTGQKYYDMVLTVLPYSNPALGLEGDFKEVRACSQTGDSSHAVNITPVLTGASKVKIKGLWIGGGTYTVEANLIQTDHTIHIPLQSVHNVTFQGNGTYSKDGLELNYTVKDTSISQIVNDNCTSIFTRL